MATLRQLAHNNITSNWYFAQLLNDELRYKWRQNNPNTKMAAVMMWTELKRMTRVRCKVCQGYLHTHKACPTDIRFRKLAKASSYARNKLACTRHKFEVELA